jgi:hypothetical protein
VQKKSATVAIIGAGDFIGGEIAKKFASEGFTVFVGRRQGEKLAPLVREIEAAGGTVFGRALDARKEDEVVSFLGDADKHAPLEVCVFNIGANVNFPIVDTTERVFRKVWEMACYSGFLAGREAARLMLPRGKGNIFFTGATASLRGGSGFAAFASAKFGGGAVDRTRTWVEKYPRRPSRDRRQRRYRMGASAHREPGGAAGDRESRSEPPDAPGCSGGSILADLSAAARCLDIRARDQAIRREMVGERTSGMGAFAEQCDRAAGWA